MELPKLDGTLSIGENYGKGWSVLTAVHPNVKYVHQLQNLYYALTGSEL